MHTALRGNAGSRLVSSVASAPTVRSWSSRAPNRTSERRAWAPSRNHDDSARSAHARPGAAVGCAERGVLTTRDPRIRGDAREQPMSEAAFHFYRGTPLATPCQRHGQARLPTQRVDQADACAVVRP